MGVPVAMAVIGGLSLVQSHEQGRKTANAQEKAMNRAEKDNAAQAALAERGFNKANMKQPDKSGLMNSNIMSASKGMGSTLLTGPEGIEKSSLTLGKTNLLGA